MNIRARPFATAFSLVEVLVAVLVLALGLLGLGAVFPVVVRQQRIATQTTLGLSAREATRQILVNNANFAPGGPGWEELHQYVLDNGGRGIWTPVIPDPDTKAYVLGAVTVPISQRLYPLPHSSDSQPRFAWDMVARVVNPLDPPADHEMLVAVFLRPIDPGIRPGLYRDPETDKMVPYSLATSLVDDRPAVSRYPVAVDRDGRPTFDGRGDYAVPLVARVELHNSKAKDEIKIERVLADGPERDVVLGLLALPGQRFLDRDGRLYSVIGGVTRDNERLIRITPALEDRNDDGSIEDDVNPILFVPQSPAVDPIVFTVTP